MGLRLLAILLLIAPTFQGRALSVSSQCSTASAEALTATGCDMTMAGDPCGCCASPTDNRQPDEPTPMPTRTGDLLVASIVAPPMPVAVLDWSGAADPILAGDVGLDPETHNVVQALLGIWRT